MEIDNSINEENPNLDNQKVYICHYPEGNKYLYFSKGTISKMLDNNSFKYKIESKKGSSGSPILNYDTNLVIGIHKGGLDNYGIHIGKGIIIKKAIKKFIEKKIKEKINNINDGSYKEYKDLYSSIDIIYSCPPNKPIQLFDQEFVINNKDICKIKYGQNNDFMDIIQYMPYNKLSLEDRAKGEFTIQLIGINKVTNMMHMFRRCENLKKLPNISKIDTSHVINMRAMFEECNNLEFPDLSSWNVENVEIMRGFFYSCWNLKFLPGIERWNPIKLKVAKEMFFECKSLPPNEIDKLNNWPVSKNILDEMKDGYEYGKDINKVEYALLKNTEETAYILANNVGNLITNLFKK